MKRRPSRVPQDPNISPELRDFLDDLDRKFPLSKSDATSAPAVTNDIDEGYQVSSRWIDVTADKEYVCVDNTAGAAVWKQTG